MSPSEPCSYLRGDTCGPTGHAHEALASMYAFVWCAIGTAPSAEWRDCARGAPTRGCGSRGGTPSLPGGGVSPIWITRSVRENFLHRRGKISRNFRNFGVRALDVGGDFSFGPPRKSTDRAW